ncbi:hypothetical protein [Longispora albida]|uniref:hypothetical protein n=1 Tax=Longispora albida TaxID=203523 RepID=UPI0003A45433|nr:hypothetical protein [Longispora albida]
MSWTRGPDRRRWWVGRRWLPWRPRTSDLGNLPSIDMPDAGDDWFGIIILVVVIVLFGIPLLLFVLTFVLEWLLLLLLLPVVMIGRSLFGVPWTIVARTKGTSYTGQATGWRASAELIGRTEAEIARSGAPWSLTLRPRKPRAKKR